MRHNNYHFGRPPDAPQTPADSPFRGFDVKCLKCHSYRLRLVSEFDDDSGELRIILTCTRCRQRETMPVR